MIGAGVVTEGCRLSLTRRLERIQSGRTTFHEFVTALSRGIPLLPRVERPLQHRVAFRRLLEDEFGDASVIEQQREIEPGPRLHEVQVAGGLLVALGEREQKVVVADLDLGRAQRFGSGRNRAFASAAGRRP